MNQEYKKRMECAYEAANAFFELIKSNDNMELLQNNDRIQALYLKAHDAAGRSTEEEKDFYFEYSIFFEYKAFLLVASGEFARIMAGKRTLAATDLKPVYDTLTQVMDQAIAQRDRFMPFYLKNKEEIISEFNHALGKFGFAVDKAT